MGSDAVSYQGLTLSPILFVTAIQIFTDGFFFFVICWEIRLEVLGGGEDGEKFGLELVKERSTWY